MRIIDLDHVQLAIPEGGEERARGFYGGLLGLAEITKPEDLPSRSGVWFSLGPRQLHLGVEADFRPATKAHPGFEVDDLDRWTRHLATHGVELLPATPVQGRARAHCIDPFGNRLELIVKRS